MNNVLDTIATVVEKTLIKLIGEVGEVRPLLCHHTLQLGGGGCCQKDLSKLKVKDFVQSRIKLAYHLPVTTSLYTIRLNGVDGGLDD